MSTVTMPPTPTTRQTTAAQTTSSASSPPIAETLGSQKGITAGSLWLAPNNPIDGSDSTVSSQARTVQIPPTLPRLKNTLLGTVPEEPTCVLSALSIVQMVPVTKLGLANPSITRGSLGIPASPALFGCTIHPAVTHTPGTSPQTAPDLPLAIAIGSQAAASQTGVLLVLSAGSSMGRIIATVPATLLTMHISAATTLTEGSISGLAAIILTAPITGASTALLMPTPTLPVTAPCRPPPSTTPPAVTTTSCSTLTVVTAPATRIATGSPDAILAAGTTVCSAQ